MALTANGYSKRDVLKCTKKNALTENPLHCPQRKKATLTREVYINVNIKTWSVNLKGGGAVMKINPLSEQAAQSWRDVGVHELQGVITFTVSSELTRGSLIRLQQSDNGRVALGTFNELLQRQSACWGGKENISYEE